VAKHSHEVATVRPPFFASESRALKRLADALPGRGALTLLGAPMLAVVATFCLQPKAVGSEPADSFAPAGVASTVRPLDNPTESPPAYESTEPFQSVLMSIEAHEFERARELLAAVSETNDPGLRKALEVIVDCLQSPSNDTTAHAFRYYLEQAPVQVRPRLRAACLSTP
jgi:hypothetical protein